MPLSLFPSHLGFPLGSGSSLTLPRGPRGIAGSRGRQQERGPHGVTATARCGPSGATPTSPPIDLGDLLGFLCHCCAGPWGAKRARTGVVGAEGAWEQSNPACWGSCSALALQQAQLDCSAGDRAARIARVAGVVCRWQPRSCPLFSARGNGQGRPRLSQGCIPGGQDPRLGSATVCAGGLTLSAFVRGPGQLWAAKGHPCA